MKHPHVQEQADVSAQLSLIVALLTTLASRIPQGTTKTVLPATNSCSYCRNFVLIVYSSFYP